MAGNDLMDCFPAELVAQSMDRLWSTANHLYFLDVEIENLLVTFEDAATCNLADVPPQTQMGAGMYVFVGRVGLFVG